MAEDRIRIGFNGYEHAAFNCLSPDSVNRQIAKGLEVDASLWEMKPRGYWPSDCRWDPYVGYVMRDLDIGWVFMHWEDLKGSLPGGQFHPDWRALDPYRPINVNCPMGVQIPAVLYMNPNYDLFKSEEVEKFFDQLATLHTQRQEDAYLTVGLDLETVLVLEVKGIAQDAASVVDAFFERLIGLPYVNHVFSDEVVRAMPPTQETFARPSYWGHFGGAYPDGMQKVLSLCDTAERDLLMCENILALLGDHADAAELSAQVENAWDHLLIGENSEVRFTDPDSGPDSHTFYPNAALVLETYAHSIQAYEAARALKQRLFRRLHNRRD